MRIFIENRSNLSQEIPNLLMGWGSNLDQIRLEISVSTISLCLCLSSSTQPQSPPLPTPDPRTGGPAFGIPVSVIHWLWPDRGCRRGQWPVTSQMRCLLSAKNNSPGKGAAGPLAANTTAAAAGAGCAVLEKGICVPHDGICYSP